MAVTLAEALILNPNRQVRYKFMEFTVVSRVSGTCGSHDKLILFIPLVQMMSPKEEIQEGIGQRF